MPPEIEQAVDICLQPLKPGQADTTPSMLRRLLSLWPDIQNHLCIWQGQKLSAPQGCQALQVNLQMWSQHLAQATTAHLTV